MKFFSALFLAALTGSAAAQTVPRPSPVPTAHDRSRRPRLGP